MAEPTFGQDKIKDIPPLNLLDALYAQGLPLDYLRQMIGMRTPEITSFLLRGGQDRYLLDRAVNMAKGKELEAFGKTGSEYDRLKLAFENRGINTANYKGAKNIEGLMAWASNFDKQIVGNAAATVLGPQQKAVGGFSLDEHRKMVTGFSAPTPPGELPGVTTTRGIPSPGGQGVRGQGGPTGVPGETPGGPTLAGTTAAAKKTGGNGGGGASGTPAPAKATPAQVLADIESMYGWSAAMMDIPEVAKILNDVASGKIDAKEANARFMGTNYFKETTKTQREWKTLNPGDKAYQLQAQLDSIVAKAQAQGINIDPGRAREIAESSKSQGWSDQMINRALASEIKWDPQGAKTGVLAQLKQAVQNQLVPMSDQAMTQWAQAVVSGAKTTADFEAYLKDQAKSLFPTMANYLDTTPGGNVKTYLDPYAQTIAKTLGTNPADIDWMDPKWYRFVNQIDPKTGQRGMVDIAEVQKVIVADKQYGWDQTANGKTAKANLARTILSDWGYLAGKQEGFA